MSEPLVFEDDDEKFCRRCLAGVDSSEHAEKCYYRGLAEMGKSA